MRYVVVGAGVAGVCCARELLARLQPGDELTLVAPGDAVKSVENVERVTRRVEVFDVVERPLEWLQQPNVTLRKALVTSVDDARKVLHAVSADGRTDAVPFDWLCVATGARPRAAPATADCAAHVLTLRDTDSVAALAARLGTARRVLLVGNGGIALELVDALTALARQEVVWAVRHGGIGDAFFDRDAAAFLQSVLTARCAASVAAAPHGAASGKQALGNAQQQSVHNASPCCGAAVGPHWVQQLQLLAGEGGTAGAGAVAGVRVELSCELASLRAAPAPADWPVLATLTSGEQLGVDVVILATGVEPSVEWAPPGWQRGADGGLAVDAQLQVLGAPAGVHAAGDAASAAAWAQPHWHQMRLWSQARASGTFAAACAGADADDVVAVHSGFDLFTHCTRFLGQQVILLGRYNGQGLSEEGDDAAAADSELCSYSRITPPGPGGSGGDFVRVLLLRGRVRGAVLIGEHACGLAETFEHLILDELDVGALGPHLLDPELDLEDYFD